MFFKETLTEWFFVEPEMVLMASLEEPFEAPLFLRVYWGIVSSVMDSRGKCNRNKWLVVREIWKRRLQARMATITQTNIVKCSKKRRFYLHNSEQRNNKRD